MPSLILLRHAKSAWDNQEVADFERPLSTRGRKSAPVVGAYLARNRKALTRFRPAA